MLPLTTVELAAALVLAALLGLAGGLALATWFFARTMRRLFPLCIKVDQRTQLDVVHHASDRPPLPGDEWKQSED